VVQSVSPPSLAHPETSKPPAPVTPLPATTTPPPAVAAVQDPPAQITPIAPPAKTITEPAPVVSTTTAPAALETKPSDTPKTALTAAVDALNTFSNYCASTLAADNDRIKKISNNQARTKMGAASLNLQEAINNTISQQQEYLESLTTSAEADASVKQSTPPMIYARQSATNALTRFDAEIYNASLRR
jgi:hypothetical protein